MLFIIVYLTSILIDKYAADLVQYKVVKNIL